MPKRIPYEPEQIYFITSNTWKRQPIFLLDSNSQFRNGLTKRKKAVITGEYGKKISLTTILQRKPGSLGRVAGA